MTERLQNEQGLRISSVLDGASERLQDLVRYATHPEVTTRFDSVGDFLDGLERFEEEITRPDEQPCADPLDARPRDALAHGLVVKRRLGRGSTALLERFGEDLLVTVDWLEQKGIPHRDIKPENLGAAKLDSRLHLVLFDFSLAGIPAENVLAGTRHYLDPFLGTRTPPRWDTHAERFAAAVTLYQMSTGALPRWGDGQSEPAVLDCEAALDADAFEPATREGMIRFFGKALRRDYRERFDNAQEMLRAWRQLFLAADRPEASTDAGERREPAAALDQATLRTLLSTLGLSARGLSAVERMNVRTVEDLLRFPLIQVNRMRGVGSRTRKELTELARRLAERSPEASRSPKTAPAEDAGELPESAARASVDALRRQLLPAGRTARSQRDAELLAAFLGLRGEPSSPGTADLLPRGDGAADDRSARVPWPSQSDVGRHRDAVRRRPRSTRRRCLDHPGRTAAGAPRLRRKNAA